MNRLFSFLLGMITILSFTNVMGQKFLPQPTIPQSMWAEKDWYDRNTRQYIFSHIWVSNREQSPEKAAEVYEYIRVEREFKVKADGTKFIRWYVDFNADRDAHPVHHRANFYGLMLDNSVGKIYNMYYEVYDASNNMRKITDQSGHWNDPVGWRRGTDRVYHHAKIKEDTSDGYFYVSMEYYRRIINGATSRPTESTAGNYDHRRYDYVRPVVHNARKQMDKLALLAIDNGQVFVNAGPSGSDNYRYVYQFDTDILDDTKEHYYIAFHNVSNAYAQHIVAFLPPEDGQEETAVYIKPTPQTITTEVGVVPDVKRGISNLSAFPNDAVWEWIETPDVSQVGTTQGKAKVTYYVNNEPVRMEVIIPVVVEDNKKDADIYAPTGNTIRFLNGENLANKAGEFITLPADYPADKARPTYAWKNGTPTTTTGGSFAQVVNVIYPDNSIDEVSVNLDIVNLPAQPTIEVKRQTSEADIIAKVQAGTNREYSWGNGKQAEVKSVPTANIPSTEVPKLYNGTESAIVSIENKEGAGSKKVLSSSSLPNTSYSLANGQLSIITDVQVPVRVVANDADTYSPTGKTVRLLNGEDIDDNAGDFVNLSNAPQGTQFVWKTKPNTNQSGLTSRKSESGVVTVNYPDGSSEDVNVTADIVPVPAQNRRAYILQGTPETDAKSEIQAKTNRPAAWASGKAAEVVGSIDTSVVGDFDANVSIENRFNVNTGIITGASSIAGTTYSKPTAGSTSIITDVQVPYTIINKPVKTDDNPVEVKVGEPLTDDMITDKITNKDGWVVSSITGKPSDTDSISSNTVVVVLTHPNLPEEQQTFEIPVSVWADPDITMERHIYFLPKRVKLETPLQLVAVENTGADITYFVRNTERLGLSVNANGQITGTVPAGQTVSWYSRYISVETPNIKKEWTTQNADNKFVINVTEAVGGEDTHEYGNTFTIDQILALTTIKSESPNFSNAQQNIIRAYEESNEWAPHSSYNDLSNVERYIAKKEFVDAQGNPLTQTDVPTSGKGNEVYVKVYYKDTMNGNIIGSEIVKNIINYTTPICVKPANTNGLGEKTNFGITDLGRAGETPNAWPRLRKGGWIALESNDKGFVITRTTENQITNPQEGMLIYDTANHCLKLYDGTKWSCFSEPSCPTEPNN